MANIFKVEMSAMYQTAGIVQRGLEALVKNCLRCEMDLVATGSATLRNQTRWMDAKLFIILHGCDQLGRTYWKRPNPRLLSSIGCCWALLYRVQERLDKIYHESSEGRDAQSNLYGLMAEWHRFCVALKKSGTDLKAQFSRRKKITNSRAFLN